MDDYYCQDCGLGFEDHDLDNLDVKDNGTHICDNCGGDVIQE